MKNNDITLAGLLKKIVNKYNNYSRIGKVISVDDSKGTCVVDPLDGGSYYTDVKLACDGGNNIIFPRVDSMVIISFLDENKAFVDMFSKIDKVKHTNSNETSDVDDANINTILNTFKNDIKTYVDSLHLAIDAITLNTAVGPTAAPPVNKAQFDAAKTIFSTGLDNFVKGIDTLYKK